MRRDELASKINNHFDIVDVISRYLNVIKRGQNFFAVCPFHNDTRPSLVISRNKKIFKCFVCNEAGNVISFVSKIKKIPFEQAMLELAKEMGINVKESAHLVQRNQELEKYRKFCEANKQAQEIFANFLYAPENKNVLDSLYKRGLDDKLIKEFGLGFAPKDNMILKIMTNKDNFFGANRDQKLIWPLPELLEYSLINVNDKGDYSDFFINRIIFPIKDVSGNIIGFSGRDLNKESNIKYLNSKSSKFFQKNSCLYNLDKALDSNKEKLYITEGYMDVISCYKYDLKNIVGTMGTAFNENHIKLLKRQNVDTVILAMDNDNAGIAAEIQMGLELLKHKINVYALKLNPYNTKDLDEFVNSTSQNNFNDVMNSYYSFIEFLIDNTFKYDLKIDDRLKALNYIEGIISEYGDPNLYSFYANILSEKSGMDFNDIKTKIESSNSFSRNIINAQNRLNDIKKNFAPKKKTKQLDLKILQIYRNERTLVFNMIYHPEIIKYFVDNLNYFYLENADPNYKIIRRVFADLVNYRNLNENIIFDNLSKRINTPAYVNGLKNEYQKYKINITRTKNESIPQIVKQSLDIIIDSLRYKSALLVRTKALTEEEASELNQVTTEKIRKLQKVVDNYEG